MRTGGTEALFARVGRTIGRHREVGGGSAVALDPGLARPVLPKSRGGARGRLDTAIAATDTDEIDTGAGRTVGIGIATSSTGEVSDNAGATGSSRAVPSTNPRPTSKVPARRRSTRLTEGLCAYAIRFAPTVPSTPPDRTRGRISSERRKGPLARPHAARETAGPSTESDRWAHPTPKRAGPGRGANRAWVSGLVEVRLIGMVKVAQGPHAPNAASLGRQ